MGVGCLEGAEGRDDEAVGVEAIAEEGLLDCVFVGSGPDESSASEGGGVDAFGVEIEVFCEEAGKRSEDYDAGRGDFDFGGSADGFVFEEIERDCDEKSDDRGLADAANECDGEPCSGPSPHGVFMGEIKRHQRAENTDHANVVRVKEEVVTEAEVRHGRKNPGHDGDGGCAQDETLHDTGGAVLRGLVAEDEPDGGDVGDPGGPEAECGVERAGGPEETDEVEGEKGGDPAQRGSLK